MKKRTAMGSGQIIAVDHVELEGAPGLEPELVAFYCDVGQLPRVEGPLGEPPRLRFRSGQIELRYALVPTPRLSPVACRLVVAVPRLREARQLLDERKVAYERIRGLGFTDRRLSLLDPAGNRVEFKQDWPRTF